MTKITLEQWNPVTWLGGYVNCTHEVTNQLGGFKSCARCGAVAREVVPETQR